MSKSIWVMGVGVAAAWLSFPVVSVAQECKTNQDCALGFTCKAQTAKTIVAVPSPTCMAGKDCPVSNIDPIVVESYSYCGPQACTTDVDCPETMVCHGETSTSCSGGGNIGKTSVNCALDAIDCKPEVVVSEPPICTTETTYACAYRWQLPCKTDVGCGTGFICNPLSITSCSGTAIGGSTGGKPAVSGVPLIGILPSPDAPDVSPVMPAPVCETTTSFPGSCRPKNTTCKVDADCPSSWTCKEISMPTRDATAPVTQPSAGGGMAVTTGGNMAPTKGGAIATGGTMAEGGATSIGSGSSSSGGGGSSTGGQVTPLLPSLVCVSPFGGGGNEGWVVSVGEKGGTQVDNTATSGGPLVVLPPPTASVPSDPSSTGAKGAEVAKAEAGGGCSVGQGSSGTLPGLFLVGFVGLLLKRRKVRN